ncbi:short chain dehydrogenase [Mycolicibacterium moriokaense]|uniref:SDR family oxidoreductase n=1 Tax=Mycolicibacterium moriokaense TaxID=39691 RepID=UPI0009F508C6|nr:SDR family oxidoreductase [Mycolicibacterium moriokaense]MCV7041530.1 SDR family oxidoreductase [Mycolicibacterium moriokaense]ORB18394.1 short chain dehydrogenase [Mycolicibacterium moriokaense]
MTDRPEIVLGLHGKVVLVTGGVRGVGAGISSVFAAQGATVVTCARRPVEGLPYEFHSCDVRDDEAVAALIETVADKHGRLDIVVNNAGGSPYVLAAESSAKFNTKIVELNLLGPLSVSIHANAVMQTQPQGGSIINIASVSGRRPTPGTAPYGAAKAGMESITSTLAVEWAPKVRVNSVVVGMVETEQSELFYGDADSIAAISKNVPLGRLAKPDDVGWAAAFLASDAASYISGASLEVHGGGEPPHYLATTTADIK